MISKSSTHAIYKGPLVCPPPQVARQNLGFGFAVQGLAMGAAASSIATTVVRGRVLEGLPELADYIDWLALSISVGCALAAAKFGMKYRGIMTIIASSLAGVVLVGTNRTSNPKPKRKLDIGKTIR